MKLTNTKRDSNATHSVLTRYKQHFIISFIIYHAIKNRCTYEQLQTSEVMKIQPQHCRPETSQYHGIFNFKQIEVILISHYRYKYRYK